MPTCPTNTTSPAGSSSYTDCRAVAGWFYPHGSPDTDESTLAIECDEDTYCSGDNETAVPCPLNTNTNGEKRKTQKSDCVADPGYYYDVDDASHTYAQACPVGTYNPNTGTVLVTGCQNCPQDTYSDNTALTTSDECSGCPLNSSTTYDLSLIHI